MSKQAELPNIEDLYTRTPLYKKFDLSILEECDRASYLDSMAQPTRPIDVYCIGCKHDRPFEGHRICPNDEPIGRGALIAVEFVCCMDKSHKMQIIFRVDSNVLIKIGQFPSLADIHAPPLQKYKKILTEENLQEFGKAIGLASHGIGVGSYVYLRRIFENLIKKAHEKAKGSHGWDEGAFLRSRMDEKIALLTTYLPEFLSGNKSLYGIISKGIHELTEDECLAYFNIIRMSIELILDQNLELLRREETQKKMGGALNEIQKKLKPPAH